APSPAGSGPCAPGTTGCSIGWKPAGSRFSLGFSLDHSCILQGQKAEQYFAQDIFLRDAADRGGPAVQRGVAVVPHQEQLPLGDSIGELDVVAQEGGLGDVVLLQHLAVDRDGAAGIVDGDGIPALGDDPLDQRPAVGGVVVYD